MDQQRQITVINQNLAGLLSQVVFKHHKILFTRSEFPDARHHHTSGHPQYDGLIHKEFSRQ